MLERLRPLLGVAAVVLAGIWITRAVLAAWVEPTSPPPAGNPPGFVWTQSPDATAQMGGQFNVAGGGKVGGLFWAFRGIALGIDGTNIFDPDSNQNIIYGAARYSGMDATNSLLLLQTKSDSGSFTGRLRVDRDGNVFASGSISALGCVGPVFRRLGNPSQGSMGGYVGANGKCPAGEHICSVEEVQRSIACGALRAALSDGYSSNPSNPPRFWIAGGPAGYTAPANDCRGWTSSEPSELGRFWSYDNNGGVGWLTSCNVSYNVGCCG